MRWEQIPTSGKWVGRMQVQVLKKEVSGWVYIDIMFDTQQIPKGKLNTHPILVCTPKDAGLHNHKMRHSCEISYLPTPTSFGPYIDDDYHLIQFIRAW
jgi:hypothetical protein